MGLTHGTVTMKASPKSRKKYEADFLLVDTGATGSMAPADGLRKAGIFPIGKTVYERADGSTKEYEFGLAVTRVMGEVTAGRIIFGPRDSEPLDSADQTLKRMPAIPLK